jgi:hypothetical protein
VPGAGVAVQEQKSAAGQARKDRSSAANRRQRGGAQLWKRTPVRAVSEFSPLPQAAPYDLILQNQLPDQFDSGNLERQVQTGMPVRR